MCVDTWNEKPCKILTYITCFFKVFSITRFIARLHSVRAKMVRVRVKMDCFFTRTLRKPNKSKDSNVGDHFVQYVSNKSNKSNILDNYSRGGGPRISSPKYWIYLIYLIHIAKNGTQHWNPCVYLIFLMFLITGFFARLYS